MASTLSFLKLPVHLPHKPNYFISKLQPQLSTSKPSTPNQLTHTPPPLKLITTTLHTYTQVCFSSPHISHIAVFLGRQGKMHLLLVGSGILEGRTFALIHPVVMGGLFVYTLWAGYLGWQWRRVRTIQDEINELKKQEKPTPVAPDGTPIEAPPSPVSLQIKQLTEERKQLVKGGYRDRHFNAGSLLLGFGVLEAIGGGVNTYLRTGKLFPGPHLYAGAGITVLWAFAAALVPAMQKGNETARSLHIALNAINVLLFIWQIPTGLGIVWKVFEFTKWP